MQVTETLNEGLRRGYEITVPAAELDAKVQAKLAEAQPGVQMKGFRKGKVPLAMLRKRFGPQLLGEAMQETVDGAMSRHFEESRRPAGDAAKGRDARRGVEGGGRRGRGPLLRGAARSAGGGLVGASSWRGSRSRRTMLRWTRR